ncbi:hypothetical protein [Sphingomonas bacterium]|uniref:hypothetical protein n=1 Tax=Sphingomonas bacterium TaxID=1895847 RepID=UPI0015772A5C|nr:hypothetical protein [Sphingomonas bacterium]
MLKRMTMAGLLAGSVAGLGMASPASAADNPMQVCGARYQAAKTAKTLPAGQTWPQFLAQCRGTLSRTAAASTPAPAAVSKAPMSAPGKMAAVPKPAGQVSAAQLAARSRQKQCAQNYQADKSANKLAGQSWPKYYSACSTRLKA